ncbi:MAG: hypothetical protein AAFY25_02650 [Pseudomonadota bacterium]
MRVVFFGEDNSVSDLTPDGDPAEQATVAIRPFFSSKRKPRLSAVEVGLMRKWAATCSDRENGKSLLRLLESLS